MEEYTGKSESFSTWEFRSTSAKNKSKQPLGAVLWRRPTTADETGQNICIAERQKGHLLWHTIKS